MSKHPASRAAASAPLLDILESRRLFALSVVASGGDDLIRIARDGGDVLVVTNGVTTRHANASGIVVDAGDGADTVRVEDAGGLPVTLLGGGGDDRFEVGAGDLAAAALASVSVVGGAGVDALVIDDSLATVALDGVAVDNPYDTFVSVSLPRGLGVVVADASNAANAVESVRLVHGAGDDAIGVYGTHARVALAVEGGGGDDRATVNADLDTRLRGAFRFDGGAGANTLVVDDSADAFGDTYFLGGAGGEGTLRKDSGGATIGHANVNALMLWAGIAGRVPSNQQFRVAHLPAQASATIFAGPGDDVLWYGDAARGLDGLTAGVVLAGQEGVDRVVYDDAAGTRATRYEVTPIAVNRSAWGTDASSGVAASPVLYFDVESVEVRANASDNVLRVAATSGTTNVTLFGNGGDDRFEVGAGDLDATVANSVSVVGGAGDDALFLDDRYDDAGGDNAYAFSTGLLLRTLKAVLWSVDADGLTERVSLAGSGGDDAVRVTSATPAVALTIDAGDGDDGVVVDRTSAGENAPVGTVAVVTGAGRDTLDVNADGLFGDANVTLPQADEAVEMLRVRVGGRVDLTGGPAAVATVGTLVLDGAVAPGGLAGGALNVGTSTLVARAGNLAAIRAGVGRGGSAGGSARTVAVVAADAVGLPSFGGVATLAGDVIVRYTLRGDANVDRSVGFDDLLALAQHYGSTAVDWSKGDFDGDGAVGFDDLLALAQHYGTRIE